MNHDRAFIAYHEAGHAVADIVFEHDLGAVTIEPDGEGGPWERRILIRRPRCQRPQSNVRTNRPAN